MVMAGLLDTFQAIPPGLGVFTQSITEAFVTLVAESFSLAVRAAAPAIVSLLLASLVMGLIGRTVPQLNVMNLGFALNSLLTFAVLSITLGAALWAFHGSNRTHPGNPPRRPERAASGGMVQLRKVEGGRA